MGSFRDVSGADFKGFKGCLMVFKDFQEYFMGFHGHSGGLEG